MAWQKMLFRGEQVWVHVSDDGRPVLDAEGRAEMKYRENDSKSYRPGPANLAPAPGATSPLHAADSGTPRLARPSARTTAPASTSTSAGPARDSAAARAGGRPATSDGATLDVWTDGACSGNPGPMGIGVVVIDGKHRDELGEYLGTGTNNIAELVAIERGLDVALDRISGETRRVRIHSDSSYAIGLLDKSWKAKANAELVSRIRRKLAAFPVAVEFVKVAGHAGIAENERCDELARAAVESGRSVRR